MDLCYGYKIVGLLNRHQHTQAQNHKIQELAQRQLHSVGSLYEYIVQEVTVKEIDCLTACPEKFIAMSIGFEIFFPHLLLKKVGA